MKKQSPFEIIYEDESLIACNKSSGLLSVPGRKQEQISLKGLLMEQYKEIFTIHRIDRETSGLILFAKNATTHSQMNQLFAHRSIEKTYMAIVDNELGDKTGLIDIGIAPDPGNPGLVKIAKRGKPSQTSYELIEQFKNYALLALKPLTGRTHQIRIHCKYIGHPLVVDEWYGKRDAIYISDIKQSKKKKVVVSERPLLKRLSLHAYKLSFVHPASELQIKLEAEPPKDLQILLKQLRKWNAK